MARYFRRIDVMQVVRFAQAALATGDQLRLARE